MSLQPQKNKKTYFGSALLGACLAVASSVFITAFLGAFFGDTYNTRLLIYLGLLSWVIVGAISIYYITSQTDAVPPSIRLILLWFLSTWLWPIPVLMWLKQRKS